MNKKIISLLVLVFLNLPLLVRADGTVIRLLPEGDWSWTDQNSQQAFINYQDGIEKLIVAVDIEEQNSDNVWIIPIPGKPEEVGVDIVSELPVFFGDEVMSKAKNNLLKGVLSSFASQLWTLSYFSVSTGGGWREMPKEDISVKVHIEKEGIVSEVITAKSTQALYKYLSQKGLNIKQGSISVLNSYIGKDYVFIASWISGSMGTDATTKRRGIFVTFPTERIYYPLLPTSVYGEGTIPIVIRVLGYVKPHIFSEIEPYTNVQYFTQRTKPGWKDVMFCEKGAYHIMELLSLYKSGHGEYPSSLQELKYIKEDMKSRYTNAKKAIQEAKEHCWGPILYRTKKDRKEYKSIFFLGPYLVFVIDSRWQGLYYEKEIKEINKKEFIPSLALQRFYGDKAPWRGRAEYTKVVIKAPAKLFKKDLWMEKERPLQISLALWGIDHPEILIPLFYFFSTAIFSFLVGGLTGWICFRKFKKYALVGLANIATLIGLMIAMCFIKREEKCKCTKPAFVGLFSVFFVVFGLLLWCLIGAIL